MVCKLCNTRLRSGEVTCPNCGRASGDTLSDTTSGASGSKKKKKSSRPAAKSKAKADLELDEFDEMDELVDLDGAEELELEDPAGEEEEGADVDGDSSTPALALDAEGLREMLALRPEILEEGLRVVKDTKGKPAGARYTTDAGEIDLLAQDKSKNFVVVMVADPDQVATIVGDVLQRVGWVRKHLAKGNRKVRGIVLLDEDHADLSYSAAAVADTIEFKTYRIAVAFQDLSI